MVYVAREHFVLPFPDGEQLFLIRMDQLLLNQERPLLSYS